MKNFVILHKTEKNGVEITIFSTRLHISTELVDVFDIKVCISSPTVYFDYKSFLLHPEGYSGRPTSAFSRYTRSEIESDVVYIVSYDISRFIQMGAEAEGEYLKEDCWVDDVFNLERYIKKWQEQYADILNMHNNQLNYIEQQQANSK